MGADSTSRKLYMYLVYIKYCEGQYNYGLMSHSLLYIFREQLLSAGYYKFLHFCCTIRVAGEGHSERMKKTIYVLRIA
jgi:hypothetical protein